MIMAPKSYKETVCFLVFLICLVSNTLHADQIYHDAAVHFNDLIMQLRCSPKANAEVIIFEKILAMTDKSIDDLSSAMVFHASMKKISRCRCIYNEYNARGCHHSTAHRDWMLVRDKFRTPIVVKMINIQDENGKTLLHYAARNLCYEAIRLLIFLDADTHVQNKRQETALHILVKYVINQSLNIQNKNDKEIFKEKLRGAPDTVRALLFFKKDELDDTLLMMRNESCHTITEMINASTHDDFLKHFLTLDELYRCSY